jgi:hypothetical protein
MVASGVVSQKLCPASPIGSKKPRTGLHFLAKTARSSEVSMDIEALLATLWLTDAPLKLEGVKAAAVAAKRLARRTFIVEIGARFSMLFAHNHPPPVFRVSAKIEDTHEQRSRLQGISVGGGYTMVYRY